MKLELLMIQYKATVNYLIKSHTHDEGWHCCINPQKLGMKSDTVHVYGYDTPLKSMKEAIKIYEELGDINESDN